MLLEPGERIPTTPCGCGGNLVVVKERPWAGAIAEYDTFPTHRFCEARCDQCGGIFMYNEKDQTVKPKNGAER